MSKVRVTCLACALGLLALAGCRSAHTTSAILYIEEQQYQKAVDVIHEGFFYQDDEPDAYYYLGEAYSKLAEESVEANDYPAAKNYYEESYRAYQHAKELDLEGFGELADLATQNNYVLRTSSASREFEQDYYEQAEGHFRLAYAALPDSIGAIKNIATLKLKQASEVEDDVLKTKLREDALTMIDQVLAVRPDAYGLLLDKANVLRELGHQDEAQRLYDDLLAAHGDDPGLLTDIANLAIETGDFSRAAELSVRIADIYQNDDDPANDTMVKSLLLNGGNWFGLPSVKRYGEAVEVLDRAAELEADFPTKDTLFARLQTFYAYGLELKGQAAKESDPLRKGQLEQRSREMFQRGVDVGNALTNSFMGFADGYLFLAQCQIELGEHAAAGINLKTFEELRGGG